MANKNHIAFVLILSVIVIILIGGWLEYQKGNLFAGDQAPIEDLQIPLAPLDNEITNSEPMETQEVTFKTNQGDITLELFTGEMPITTGNFLTLASDGFYDGTKFHRVIDGFMIQGGDPNSKGDNESVYGQGGPGYTIEDEFVEGALLTNTRGTISMANTGQPNSGGSQFFINLIDNLGLDFDKEPFSSRHPVFGRVTDGMEIVDQIAKVETKRPGDIPTEPVVIESVVIAGDAE